MTLLARRRLLLTRSEREKASTLTQGVYLFVFQSISSLTFLLACSPLGRSLGLWQITQPNARSSSAFLTEERFAECFDFRDHVPFRNSKLTRMLQPSLSGNARISVICTINPDPGAVGESMSTLQFAKRIKSVQVRFDAIAILCMADGSLHLSSTPRRERSLTQMHSSSAIGRRLRTLKGGWLSVKQKHQQDRVVFQRRKFVIICSRSMYIFIYISLANSRIQSYARSQQPHPTTHQTDPYI